jgi:hypothetical protein
MILPINVLHSQASLWRHSGGIELEQDGDQMPAGTELK